jgi:hypothetical protein
MIVILMADSIRAEYLDFLGSCENLQEMDLLGFPPAEGVELVNILVSFPPAIEMDGPDGREPPQDEFGMEDSIYCDEVVAEQPGVGVEVPDFDVAEKEDICEIPDEELSDDDVEQQPGEDGLPPVCHLIASVRACYDAVVSANSCSELGSGAGC